MSARPVLVGLDVGSDADVRAQRHATAALRWGADRARLTGVPLAVATIWSYPHVPPAVRGRPLAGFPSAEERREQVRTALADVTAAAGLTPSWQPGGAVRLHALRGREARTLVADASLLVLPGSREDPDTGFLTGDVRRQFAAACTCPVVLVSARAGGDHVVDLPRHFSAELTARGHRVAC
ncbi:universal stress protein [Kineococcus glutinatus]|uniref:UspA domain-containing protein n=1 Tax=Kineococcus glutinatus TaxID=1070872 RepID=A0ABP9HI89_9ACTN